MPNPRLDKGANKGWREHHRRAIFSAVSYKWEGNVWVLIAGQLYDMHSLPHFFYSSPLALQTQPRWEPTSLSASPSLCTCSCCRFWWPMHVKKLMQIQLSDETSALQLLSEVWHAILHSSQLHSMQNVTYVWGDWREGGIAKGRFVHCLLDSEFSSYCYTASGRG